MSLTPVPAAEVADAVRRAGQDNPLLGIGTDATAGSPADRLTAGSPADPLAAGSPAGDLVDAVGGWLGLRERRVAASLVVLGYAARLVGPAIALLVRDNLVLDLRPANVRYGFDPGRGFHLDLVAPAGWTAADPAVLRDDWGRVVVDEHLAPVIAAVRSEVPVAAALLWGNVASGLAGALKAAGGSHGTGEALLGYGPLKGSGRLDGQLRFVRSTCCLYYRIEGGGMCGDCVLLPANRAR